MPNPKRKHSKSRTGKRRNNKKVRNVILSKCPNCGAIKLPHFVCQVCGYYKGIQVIKVESSK
ncbi:MAG: 50S ribosomal protein L32 [Candidatus Omnitrophica bacterium]|nr:50S ribosomal protein L32 [Candidatus Omnitrophota bacterium]MCM8802561.1 50S ribosomal protein L32 [Candidatus Omnitrophota bacterium]